MVRAASLSNHPAFAATLLKYIIPVNNSEDRCLTSDLVINGETIHWALVADGHGGKDAATLVCETFLLRVSQTATAASKPALHAAVVNAFHAMHDEVTATCGFSGTTLTVVAFNSARGELQSWNVGDSLAILVHDDGYEVLSKSFRLADNPEEQERVIALGAKLGRALSESGVAGGPLRAWPGGLAGMLDPSSPS